VRDTARAGGDQATTYWQKENEPSAFWCGNSAAGGARWGPNRGVIERQGETENQSGPSGSHALDSRFELTWVRCRGKRPRWKTTNRGYPAW